MDARTYINFKFFYMFKKTLDNIKDPIWKAFAWRFYNTFKSVILPVTLPLILYELEKTPKDLSTLLSAELWLNVAYVAVLAVLASTIAGLDKINRTK